MSFVEVWRAQRVVWGNAGHRQAEPWCGKDRKSEFKEEKLRSSLTGIVCFHNLNYLIQGRGKGVTDQIVFPGQNKFPGE